MKANELYRKAYDAHYDDCDYDKAIKGYKQLINLFPESAEAGFARKKLPIVELEKKNKEGGQKEEKSILGVEKKPLSVATHLTTANFIEGYEIVNTLGIVSAECAFKLNVSPEVSSENDDVAKGECEIIEGLLSKTRINCLKKLQKNATTIGANAVIAIKLSHNEYFRKKESILCAIAYGTAVLVDKK